MRESDIEKYLIDEVKTLGGEVRKVQWLGRSAAPDRKVLLPGVSFYIELKRPGKKPTEAQQREISRLRAAGDRVVWADTKERIDLILQTVMMK